MSYQADDKHLGGNLAAVPWLMFFMGGREDTLANGGQQCCCLDG